MRAARLARRVRQASSGSGSLVPMLRPEASQGDCGGTQSKSARAASTQLRPVLRSEATVELP